MKKVLAIMLSIAMLFGVLAINTSAEGTPTVTLVTNEGSPIATGVHTYLTVNFKNFGIIKGMDVTITAKGAVLGEVKVTGFKTLTPNENFTEVNTEDKHEIHIVDLTGGVENGKITFEVTAPEKTSPITVVGKYADSGKTLFTIETEAGNLEVKEEVVAPSVEDKLEEEYITENEPSEGQEPTYTIDSTKAEEKNVFYPQGSVYKETTNDDGSVTYTYAEKDENGNFTITDDYKMQAYEIPKNGITTFGHSENTEDSSAVRFGSYSMNNKAAKFHGTMVFEGDWVALKNYYIKNGYSVQELVAMIYKNFDETIKSTGKRFVYYNVPTGTGSETTKVSVYKFEQKNYMWKDDANGILEYAIRLSGTKKDQTYAAVAYSEDNEGVATISAEVNSLIKK